MTILHDAGVDQGGWTWPMANHSAGSSERKLLHDAGIDQGGSTVADGQSIRLSPLREDSYVAQVQTKADG